MKEPKRQNMINGLVIGDISTVDAATKTKKKIPEKNNKQRTSNL